MPNGVVNVHRQQFPDDARSDDELTLEYFDTYGDSLLTDFPDFASDYNRIKGLQPVRPDLSPEESARLQAELYPRSLPAEFGAGLKRGGLGLASTAAGAVGLGLDVIGADETARSVMETSQRLSEEAGAPELAPTVRGVENINSVGSAVRYLAGGAGEVLPSVAEALVTGAAGALAGSATVPGPGTAAGGLAGLVGKEAAKQMIKKSVRARVGATVAAAANSYGLSSGEIYADLTRNPDIRPDDAVDIALVGGAIAAIPDTFLPSYVIGKFFKTATTKPAKEAVQKYVTRLFTETAKVVPMEAGTEAFQELVGIAAEKYGDPTQRDTPFTPEQWSRIKNAAALGAIGGGIAAPVAAVPSGVAAPPPPVETPQAPADGLNLVQRYESKQQAESRSAEENTAKVTSLAQRELAAGGLTGDDLLEISKLTPEQVSEYSRVKEQLRKEAEDADQQGGGFQSLTNLGERSGTDAQLQTEEEDRTGEAEVQGARAAGSVSYSTQSGGAQPVTQVVLKPAPVVEIEPMMGIRQFRVTGKFTNPADNGVYKSGDIITEGQLARGGFELPPANQPVNEKNLWAIAQDFVDRQVNNPNLDAVQKQRFNMIWAQFRNPGPASPENLAALFGLRLDETATAMPDRYRNVRTIETETAPTVLSQSVPPAPLPSVPLKVAAGRAAATAAVIAQTSAISPASRRVARAMVTPSDVVAPHPIVDLLDFETRPLASEAGAAYFTVKGVTDKTTNAQLSAMKLAAGRGVETDASKSMTHRLTAMQRPDGKVVLMPTYMSDATGSGVVIVAEPGRKKGREMRELISKGYKPLASLYLANAVNAIDYAKPVFKDAAEFQARVGSHANARMQAALRTAEASLSRQARLATTGAQIGLRGDETIEEAEEAAALAAAAAEEAEVVAAANPTGAVQPVLPSEVILTNHLSEGIYANIQFVIESERNDANKRDIRAIVFDAIVDYALNGKYGNELKTALRELDGQLGEAGTSLAVFGRILTAYNNSQSGKDFAETLSGQAAQPAIRGVGGLPVAPPNSAVRPSQPAVPVQPAPANGAVAPVSARRRPGRPWKRGGTAKLRIGEVGGYNRGSVIAVKWQAALDALALRGVSVQVFEQHLAGVAGLSPETNEFFQRTGGGVSDNGIAIVVSDLTRPTHEDFIALLHEAAHEVFSGESQAMQAALHRAIDGLSDTQLNLQATTDVRISRENAAGLDAPTLSEERLVESFAQQGFDPTQSRGLAQAMWRFVKDLYYRASIALQQAFLGPEHVNPQRVQAYFNNRVRQFLSNDPTPTDFLSYIGGGKPTAIRQSMFYTPHDHSFVPVLMDWQNGRMVYQDFIPDTVAAALLNIDNSIREARAQFRAPGTVSGPEVIGGEGATVRASWDYAGAKKVAIVLRAAFDSFNASGLNKTTLGDPLFTYETFFNAVKGDLNLPEEVMGVVQADLQAKSLPPFDPNLALDGPVRFQNEFTERQVQSKALGAIQKWQKQLSEEYQNASNRIKGTQRELERKLTQQENMAAKYSDLKFQFENIKESIGYLFADFREDVRQQASLSRKFGTLMQSVRQLQDRQSDPIPSSYEALINRMAKRITTSEGPFMDFLRSASQLDIDWENTPLVSTDTVTGIRDLVSGLADANSLFTDLNDSERNALIALVASFAKKNDHVMAWLAVREANDHEAGTAIKAALAQARMETNADFRDARGLINRVPRMAVRADRIFRKYLEARQEAQRLNDSLHRDTTFISAYQEMVKVIEPEAQKLESAMGANNAAALTEGEQLPYVNLPTDTPDMLKKNTWTYHITGDHQATPVEVRSMIDRYNAWLDNNRAAGGVMWNKINDLVKKLEMVDVGKGKVAMMPSLLNRIFGSLSDAVNATGTPAGRALGRMFTRYSYLTGSYSQRHADIGYKIMIAAGDAMKALGLGKRTELFYDLFHDQALKFFENRRDLQESGTPEQATEAALNAVRLYYGTHPQAARFITAAGWAALRKYYLVNAEQTAALARTAKEMGIQVRDENLGFFRDPLGQPLFTHPRGMSASLESLFGGPSNAMRAAWAGTRWPKLSASDVTNLLHEEGGVEKLKALLTPRFTPAVWDQFVRPLANRPGRSVFNGRKLGDGRWKIAEVENVRIAFENSGGDAITFATGLAQLEGVAPESVNEFVGETMDTFQKFFDSVEGVMTESEAFKSNAGMAASVPRYLMDARISEEWPAEWLSYQRYDQNVARNLVHLMAYHASFGRNGETAFNHFGVADTELQHASNQWNTIIKDMELEHPKAGRLAIASFARTEAKNRGHNWRFLEYADSHGRSLSATRTRFIEWFRTQTSDLVEAKTMFEAVGTLAGLLVQGPKTALINTMDMVAGPVIQVGLNRRALSQIRRNWQSFATSVFGSLVQQVGITTQLNAKNMQRRQSMGYYDPASTVTWKERLKAELSAPVSGGAIATGLTRASRVVRTITQVGIPTPVENEMSTRLKPQAAFTQIGQWMNYALIDGVWFQYEDMALRAKKFMQDHPETINDPAFRFTWQDLGYPKSMFSEKSFAFDSLKEGLNRWGMTIEGVGRAAVKEGAPLFTEEQMRSLASMALNELSLESGPVTRPAWFNNPIIRFATPLLGWSFSKTAQLRKAFREPGGEASYYAAARGISLMLTAMLPLGLLYGLMMQKYDEDVLGKKSDIRGFGQDNNVLAAIEQLARVGTFGMWGDFANTAGNLAGQGDLRGLSVDNRVIAVNSLLNAMRALTTFVKQGDATYATVYRPLLQATGGSGYMQYAQIVNNFIAPETTGGIPLLGQFLESERRVTSRINVSNWLRAVGREMNLDVRMGRGGQFSQPNAIKPWVGEMYLAALSDDVLGFQASYQEALQAAREEGKPDAEDHVKRSFQSYHPLTTAFKTKPSEAEYHLMLARLPDDGRVDVQQAVNLFNRYGSMIGVNPSEGREEKPKKPKVFPSIESIRRRALGKAFDLPSFMSRRN